MWFSLWKGNIINYTAVTCNLKFQNECLIFERVNFTGIRSDVNRLTAMQLERRYASVNFFPFQLKLKL